MGLKVISRPKTSKQALEHFVNSMNLAEAMNECVWVGDGDHKTVYVNPMFERVSGFSLLECIGKDCSSFFDKKSKKIIDQHHRLRTKGIASQYEGSMLTKEGKKIPLLISGAPTDQGGTIGIFTNLSRVKKLAAQEKFLKEVIKHSTEAIVVLDKKRRIKLWNLGAKQLYGYKEDEVLNKSIQILIPPEEEDTNKQLLQEVEEKKYLKNFETRRLDKDGNRLNVAVSITKVTDENGRFLGYLLIYHDVSKQKKTSLELQKRFEAIQDVYKELGIQKRQIDYIYEICRASVTESELSGLEKVIVNSISMLTQADGAILRLYNNVEDVLKLKCCFGVSPKWWSKNKIHYSDSLGEEAYSKKRPIIVENVDSTSKHQGVKLLKSHKFSTMILIPLFTSSKLLGTLSIYSQNPEKFRLIETDFLEKFGMQCSLAIFAKMS